MPKYRKKPVVIEAQLVRHLHHCASRHWASLPAWVVEAYEQGKIIFANHPIRVLVKTLEGTMTGNADDMLIRGVNGELYPCKPDIFAATYEKVDPP